MSRCDDRSCATVTGMGPESLVHQGISRGRRAVDTVVYLRRQPDYQCRSWRSYPDDMGDDYEGTGWAKYVRQVSKRPGWSVARLARETGFSKSTFFDWMSPDSRKAV